MELKEAYKIMAKASGIEKGDTVKILRGWKDGELGENCGLAEFGNKYIGQSGKITDIGVLSMGYQVTFPSGNSFYFPWFVLEKFEGKPVKEFAVGDFVKITGPSVSGITHPIGKVGKIVQFNGDRFSVSDPSWTGSYAVEVDDGKTYIVMPANLEKADKPLVKFNIGDWVKVNGRSVLGDTRFDGKVCKVVEDLDAPHCSDTFRNTYGLEHPDFGAARLFFKPEQLVLDKEPSVEVKIGNCRCFTVSRSTAASLIKQLEGC